MDAAALWAASARRPCVMCGDVNVEIHHVITQQVLRRIARRDSLDVEHLRWDRRNALALCPSCHQGHHSAHGRIPRQILKRWCPHVFEMADELGVRAWLERTYPTAG